MSEINDEPADMPRTDGITADRYPVHKAADWAKEEVAAPKHRRRFHLLVNAGILVLVLILVAGLVTSAITQLRIMAARMSQINNCKKMCLAIDSIASNTSKGDIPPSYGPFPPGGTNQSFFVSLLPFIDEENLYVHWLTKSNAPVKWYIAAADPYNPGTNALISYGTNATLLTVGGNPTLPGSFKGRTSCTIVVFERTAKCGATWSSNNSYLIDHNGSSSPEFGAPASWSGYGGRATALTSAGCVVGMGDGSSRVVTPGNASAGWVWAMDPSIPGTQTPAGW